MSNSITHAWSIGEGTMRVECPDGHAEVIGANQIVTDCDAMLGKSDAAPCGKTRKVVAKGPYRYDPADKEHAKRIGEALKWP